MAMNIATSNSSSISISSHVTTLCGPNRIQHANSLEPSVPCHALSSIVSALNNQISLLLVSRKSLKVASMHINLRFSLSLL